MLLGQRLGYIACVVALDQWLQNQKECVNVWGRHVWCVRGLQLQGDVYSYICRNKGRLTEDLIVTLIMEPFLSGMAAIHSQGLIHRDIKVSCLLPVTCSPICV